MLGIDMNPSSRKWISGMSSFSIGPTVACRGTPLARSAPESAMNRAIRGRASGASRTSASRKTNRS
jgi:hypothetical protein